MSEYKSFGEQLNTIKNETIEEKPINDGAYLIPATMKVDISNPLRKLFVKLGIAKPIIKEVSSVELFRLVDADGKELQPGVIIEIPLNCEDKNV